MIVGETFCWLHLGKTGGKTSREAISLVKGEKVKKIFNTIHGGDGTMTFRWGGVDRVVDDFPDHHFNIDQYEERYQHTLSGKDILIGFRRITTWMQSFHMQQYLYDMKTNVVSREGYTKSRELERRGQILTRQGIQSSPDEVLSHYISNLDIESIHFIRCEHMYEDFLKYFGEKIDKEKLTTVCDKKIGARYYNVQKFSKEEIDCIYKANPLWAKIEDMIYEHRVTN